MATAIHPRVDVPLDGLRISWGGIWAGVLTVMGTLLFLTTLGIAVGISTLEPSEQGMSSLGIGAAIWTAASLLIALFIGGMAASRLGMVFDRAAGAFEGALVWVLSFLILLWLASSGVRLIAGGVVGAFSGISQTVASATGNMDDLSSGSVDQILQRLNDPQTAATASAATGIPQEEVRSTLNDIAQRVEAARDNPQQAATEVRQGMQQMLERARQQLPAVAERAQEGASQAAWISLGAMLLSLVAAVIGAMVGRRQAGKRMTRVSAALNAETR